MSILDDKRLSLALAHRPEFLLRLDHFLEHYQMSEGPALVLQARPANGSVRPAIDYLDNAATLKKFTDGVGTDNGHWGGFRSMVYARPTFYGVASLPSNESPAWGIEAHRDGHFIAGLRRFPPFPKGEGQVTALVDFHVDLFRDFFAIVASTLAGLGGSNPLLYETTATLVGAPTLHFVKQSEFGNQHVLGSDPLRVQNLQWPVHAAEVGTPAWEALRIQMAKGLTGAYGAKLPRPT